jgi:hypothetical protein
MRINRPTGASRVPSARITERQPELAEAASPSGSLFRRRRCTLLKAFEPALERSTEVGFKAGERIGKALRELLVAHYAHERIIVPDILAE